MSPSLTTALLIGLAWGIIIAIIMYSYFHLYGWSAITMGIIVAYILINVAYPVVLLRGEDTSSVILYVCIEIGIPIYLFIVLTIMLLRFTRNDSYCEIECLNY